MKKRFSKKLLLSVIACLGFVFSSFAQDINLNYRETPIKTILKEITGQTGYSFVYSDAIKELDKKVTLNRVEKNADINSVLKELLVGTGITWNIKGKQIALQNSVVKGSAKTAPERVKGYVSDSDGEPLVGVTIVNKTNGVIAATDVDGNYIISADEGDLLSFSLIGMSAYEIYVGKSNVINAVMTEDIIALDDVVVTGYQTISKERATGSFDIVKKAQLEKPASNISSRLIGASPGLAYSQDVYGNPTFQIRGISTFAASAPPLIIIDGFPVESTFESINPNDVENITVLKDAAAASIWGAKSANGVIVITTKNAKANSDKPVVNVDYSAFYKVSPKLNLDYTLSHASVNDIIDYELENFGKEWANSSIPTTSTYSINPRSSVYLYLTDAYNGIISEQEAMNKINALRKNNNYDQVKDLLLQNAATHQQNVNISIGTRRSSTNISLLYQSDKMVYSDQDSRKYNVGLRNRTQVFKWLDLTLNGTINYNKNNNSGYGLSGLAPYEMLLDDNGDYVRYQRNYYDAYLSQNVPLEAFPYSDWTFNPVEEMRGRSLESNNFLSRINAGLTFKIIDGLTIDTKAQYELIRNRVHNYYSDKTYEVRTMINTAATWDHTTDDVVLNLPEGGILDQSSSETSVLTLRAQVNFNRTFADKHAVAALAGIEAIDNVYQYFGYPRTYGYSDDALTVGSLVNGFGGTGDYALKDWQGNPQSFDYLNTFSHTADRYFSAFANASYTYDNKYTISGSIRTDASNLITDDPKYRYAPFWSVGASWQIGREDFLKNVEWLDALSIRATFGYNGNVDKSTTFQPLLSPAPTPSIITGENMLGINGMNPMASYGNPTLRWEKTKTFDIGFDFQLFGGKLRGKFDYYNRLSSDLIAKVSLPKVMGTSSISLNNGEISNKGIEVEVGSTIPINKNIVWDGSLMFSYNKNRVLTLNAVPTTAYQLVYSPEASAKWLEGYDMNTLWCYKYGGLVNNGTDSSPDLQPTIIGKDGVHQFLTAWPTGSADNISYDMGTTVAPVNVSFSTSLKVYNFDLSLIITGKFGHKFLRESFNYPRMEDGGIPNSKLDEVLNCDPNEMVPLPLDDSDAGASFWDRFYPHMSYLASNASLIRFQEINLSYNLPKSCTDWLGIKGLKVYAQANNPFNIYFNKWNEDPEFRRGSVRLQQAYLFGIKCNF